MIRRLRRQFILVAMLSTLAVLTVIIGVLNAANYISMNRKADMMLDLLAENGGMFPAVFMGKEVDFGELEERRVPPDNGKNKKPGAEKHIKDRNLFSSETPYETRFFSVFSSSDQTFMAYTGRIASVSEEDAVMIARSVIQKYGSKDRYRGNYGNFRYVLSKEETGGYLAVFLDMTQEIKSFRTVLLYSIIISCVGLMAVFFLVCFFSKKVFKPVEESDRKQKQFITDASHELKTPLTIISANVDVLEMESEENEWSKSIKNQVKRMSGLVEQMVTLSRLDESKSLEMNDFSLSDAILDTAQAYLPVAERNAQEMTLDIPEEIIYKGDEKQIRQMVGLLVENATKYTLPPKGEDKGRILVKLSLKGKKKIITVWNTVEETQIGSKERYFERFYRPDESRNSKQGGSGIGLSIVKSIAEAHKGKVSAESSDGKSIQFEVTL